jgi:uncharacterized cupredoxin-like copper-binding protein
MNQVGGTLSMKIRLPDRSTAASAVLLLCVLHAGCDGESQSVHIVTQDFRFTPDMIHVASDRPIELTLFNEGRESHEFQSPLLSDRSVVIESVFLNGEPTIPEHLRIAPGKRLNLHFRAQPGTYLFSCKVRGHSGMSGTLIVK